MAKETMTKEQLEAIDNYSNRIVTLKDNVTAIRQLPGMYCAGRGNAGFLSLIREIYQNAIDQVIDKLSPADKVFISYNELTREVIVSDNGMGFPFDAMVRMTTAQHTSKNYVKQKGEYSSGMHGSGLKVVNALSEECHVSSYKYDGTAMQIDLVEGYLKKGPYKIPNKEKRQGSVVRFIPTSGKDINGKEILGPTTLDWKTVYILVKRILSLTPVGSIVDFKGIDLNGVEHSEHIVNQDGIITELISNVKNPMCKPIIIHDDNGYMKLDLAFCYDGGGKDGPDSYEKVISFCNMCPTISGYHIDGVIDGICRWFVKYMNDVYLSNQKNTKNKTKVILNDIKSGLNVMISAACLEPTFVGQAKEQLNNTEMAPYCKEVVIKGLDEWSRSNPQDLSKLSKYFKDIADIRQKSENEKVKIATKYTANILTGLPSKFAKPTEKNGEIIIVEGDSAGGTAKVARDVRTQGIMPIRGKISSAYEKPYKEFWENAETQGIAKVILGGKDYTKNFDPIKDVEWEKIIFMADADVDGAHIASLLLRFFVRYMPQLIEAGKVYKALPPLYSFSNGKKITYMTDQVEYARYVQKVFNQKHIVLDGKMKKPIANKDLITLFVVNEDYYDELVSLAITYAVEPRLLEMAIINLINGASITSIKRDVKKEFRFMNAEKTKDGIIYNGTIRESNFLYMNERLANDCSRVIEILKKNISLNYILDNQETSIYGIMKAFKECSPNIQRYKGLGEMNDDQLAESTLLPTSDRMLIQYTLEDAKEEIEVIRNLESDRSKLLDFIGTVKRSDLME